MAETELISVYRATQAAGDVIFVHGLEGDSSGSWVFDRPNSWGVWLSRNRPDLNIWSLKYDLHASEWTGHSMPLPDRALNVLALFDNKNIGSRPIVFVCHSMGGLLAKELIRHSTTVTPRFKRVADQTRGIVFFSTPHAGSHLAGIAQFLKHVLRTTASISELAPHEARLRDLNIWFRNNYMQLNILPCIFFETQNTAGVRVVDETSSDGGYPQCSPIPIDATHITITKPRNYHHITVGQTLKLIDEAIPSSSHRYNHEIDFPDDAESSVRSISADGKTPEKRESLNWFDVRLWSYQKIAIIAFAVAIIVELTDWGNLWASVGDIRLFSFPRAIRALAISLLTTRLAGRGLFNWSIAFVSLYLFFTLTFHVENSLGPYMTREFRYPLLFIIQTPLMWLIVAGYLGYLKAPAIDKTMFAIAALVAVAQSSVYVFLNWAMESGQPREVLLEVVWLITMSVTMTYGVRRQQGLHGPSPLSATHRAVS